MFSEYKNTFFHLPLSNITLEVSINYIFYLRLGDFNQNCILYFIMNLMATNLAFTRFYTSYMCMIFTENVHYVVYVLILVYASH